MGDAGSRVKGLAVMGELRSPESGMEHGSHPLRVRWASQEGRVSVCFYGGNGGFIP